MPQADILSFRATLLLLPVVFLVGYYFFATVWVPRLLLTFKVRSWLTRVEAVAWPVLLTGTEAWPEIFLMFVQFAGLVWILSKLTLANPVPKLSTLTVWAPPTVGYPTVGGAPVENFFHLWHTHRQTLFFAPAAAALTTTVTAVFLQFNFYSPGKQFPFLLNRLRVRLSTAVSTLSNNQDHD